MFCWYYKNHEQSDIHIEDPTIYNVLYHDNSKFGLCFVETAMPQVDMWCSIFDITNPEDAECSIFGSKQVIHCILNPPNISDMNVTTQKVIHGNIYVKSNPSSTIDWWSYI